jgi:pimeloyl-ACP methyl ester carboxylesterase
MTLAACGGDDGGTGIAAECNPLGGQTCLLPWPSTAFLTEDSSTVTGFRLDLDVAAMPVNIDSLPIDPAFFNRFDGFAPSGPIVAVFPKGVSGTNLPHPDRLDESMSPSSPIVLVNMENGERTPFFAEIDQNVADVNQRALIIRPMIRLQPNARYAVGLRNTLEAADGTPLESPPAFSIIRDGGSFSHPRLDVASYDAIFASLAAAGLPQSDTVLAWDFHTASDEFLTEDLLHMRDVGQAAIGTAGANLSFTTEPFTANQNLVWKAFAGTFKSPDFLTNNEAVDSILRRGGDGLPQQMGMRDANYAVLVPRCAETATLPIPTIVFGHGLFGSAEDYLDDGFLQQVANQFCFNVIAGDFIGLTMRQINVAALAANDLNKASGITEKLAQSVIDFIALENLVRGPMAQHAEFQRNGQAIIDPSRVYYLGGSLGGIMGNVFMAYDQNITRGALGVPGGAWSMLFERSIAWSALKGAAQGSYTDPLEYQMLIALLAMHFEPYDPITTAPRVIIDPMPNTPP